MFFSEYKLRELANIDKKITTEEIVKAINSIGFEVEDVFKFNFVENRLYLPASNLFISGGSYEIFVKVHNIYWSSCIINVWNNFIFL